MLCVFPGFLTIIVDPLLRLQKPEAESANQLWKFTPVGPNTYVIESKVNGRAIDVPGSFIFGQLRNIFRWRRGRSGGGLGVMVLPFQRRAINLNALRL